MKKRWVTPSFESCNSINSDNVVPEKHNIKRRREEETIKNIKRNNFTLLDKYRPILVKDLIIHRNKVSELQNWFQKYISISNFGKYLLLCGPCGCGKTASLRVIAEEFGFRIIEWITPLNKEYNSTMKTIEYESAEEIFDNFLYRASRFPSLLSNTNFSSKIILIKDFPNNFLLNPSNFHTILVKYCNLSAYPIVFICNNDNLSRNLFPDELRQECNICTINFNPIPRTVIIKTLNKIMDLECKSNANMKMLTNSDLLNIYQNSDGDLRSAILQLYFNMTNDNTSNVNKSNEKNSINNTKDEVTDLFHTLGRVLYSKRISSSSNKKICNTCHNYKFVHCPEELIEAVSVHPTTFYYFLQENYVSRFSNINSIAESADRLSVADVLMAQINKDSTSMGLTVAARGLMVANNKPIKSFKSFVKPQIYSNSKALDLKKFL